MICNISTCQSSDPSSTDCWKNKRGTPFRLASFLIATALIVIIILVIGKEVIPELLPPAPCQTSADYPYYEYMICLNEEDPTVGESCAVWEDLTFSAKQHICKLDLGVSCTGNHIVKKNVHRKLTYQWKPPIIKDQVEFTVPEGFRLTGVIGIDYWVDGTGGFCKIESKDNVTVTVNLRSQMYRGMRFYVLFIVQPDEGESD